MIDNLTSSDIANNIHMIRSAHRGPILVVEGVTDSRLYGKFVDRDDVKIIIAHSKDNVRRSVATIWGRTKDRSIIGILDADLDRMSGKKYDPPLFVTDKRDLETMMLSSPALEDVLSEYADNDLLERFEDTHGNVRDVLARSAYPIGLLMFISSRDRLGLSFKDIEYRYFVNNKTLGIDVRKMIDEIFSASINKGIGKKELMDLISEEEEILDDPWTAVRGHDAVHILSIGLTDIFGSYNSKNIRSGELSGSLRLGFNMEYFRDTDIFKDILKWSERNNFVVWITQ